MIKRHLYVNFEKKNGKIRPVNSVNTGPKFGIDLGIDFSDEFGRMSVPFVRTHNVEHPYGGGRFVDIHNIFPDFSLDERFEASYNFAPTDEYFAAIKNCGAQIFLRLGESSDRFEVAPYLKPVKDAEKWARVCERIILHYNHGWANGFKYGIKFVEIYADIDEKSGWRGERVEFFDFYRRVSSYLKEKFPRIKLGAYSCGGFHSLNHFDASGAEREHIGCLEEFLDYVSNPETRAPLDFLSWKCRAETPEEIVLHANYARNYLDHSGFKRTLSVISEFSLRDKSGDGYMGKSYAADLAISLILSQKSSVDMMFLASADPRSATCPLYSLEDRTAKRLYAPYRVMTFFGDVSEKTNVVETTEDFRREIYSLASFDGKEGAVLLATKGYNGLIELNISGADFSSYDIVGLIGGGERGAGYVTEAAALPCESGKILLRAGKEEIYLLKLK